jgi:uncharacterized oligopeptide transporter (OPT) family protein
MFLGAWVAFAAQKISPKRSESWVLPLASGFIAGDALIAILLPLLIALGLIAASV